MDRLTRACTWCRSPFVAESEHLAGVAETDVSQTGGVNHGAFWKGRTPDDRSARAPVSVSGVWQRHVLAAAGSASQRSRHLLQSRMGLADVPVFDMQRMWLCSLVPAARLSVHLQSGRQVARRAIGGSNETEYGWLLIRKASLGRRTPAAVGSCSASRWSRVRHHRHRVRLAGYSCACVEAGGMAGQCRCVCGSHRVRTLRSA